MKAICKKTTSKDFDLKEVTTIYSNDFDYSFGGYGLEIDKEYIIMGLLVYQDTKCIYYLTDVNGKPDWFPYLLFEVTDNSIPKHWFVKIYVKNDDSYIYSICGFNELCNDIGFYDKLLERDETALRIYFKRKIELENELLNDL